MIKRKRIFIIGLIFIALIISSCSIVAHIIYSKTFGSRIEGFSENQFTTYLKWNEIDKTVYPREEVYFNSGKNKLQGFIYGGENDKGLVILSHGLGGSADSYLPMMIYFVDKGWRVFTFSNTGVRGSEGKNVRGLTQSVIDLDAALQYVEKSNTLKELPVMLVGHSWGGYAVCAVLNYEHNVSAVVSFAGFNNGYETFKEIGISSAGGFYYLLYPQFWAIQKIKFGNTMKLTAVDGINKATIPVMIVQSSDDDIISPATTSIYAHREKITNPYLEIIFFDGADAAGHEFVFYSKERREYIKTANENLQKYREANENASLSQWAEEYNFDKMKANEFNGELMERINMFFNNQVAAKE
jgi:pimeloyl-ACP methyl ester carboxylesterase